MITEQLIEKAKQGDSEAFTKIYNETIKTAYYVAKRILVDEQAVEDVLQESYIAVYKNLKNYKMGNFQGWVDTIVANKAKDYLHKEKKISFSPMETEEHQAIEFEEEKLEFRPDDKVDYDETKRLIMHIVDTLPPEQRLVTILYYFEQRSVKEIAEICECSENTVKSRLNYARKKIKEDVLELEKKGTKLYTVPVLPFLYWMLKEEGKNCHVPADTATKVANVAGKTVGTTIQVVTEGAAVGTATTSGIGAQAVVTDTVVKTGMALGTKIAIGATVAVLSVGGIALGSTLLSDTPTVNTETEESQQEDTTVIDTETEETTELSREEIDEIVKQFLLSYEPVSSLEVYGFTFVPDENPYFRDYAYSWCGETPLIIVKTGYNEINSQAEGITDCTFFSVDKTTGEIIELQRPACFEYVEYSFRFYAGEEGIVVEKNYWPDESSSYYLEKFSADTNEWTENAISVDQGQAFINNGSFQPMEYSLIASLTATEGVDEEKILAFLNGYTPEETFDVYELKGYPATTCTYRADLGVQYVSFAAGQCNVLVVATPYSATAESSFISYKYEVYYYDEAAATYKFFDNQPDTTHDEDAYPTEYNFDIVANDDGISNTFTFMKGGTRIGVEIDGTALRWEYYHYLIDGGNFDFLEWKKVK